MQVSLGLELFKNNSSGGMVCPPLRQTLFLQMAQSQTNISVTSLLHLSHNPAGLQWFCVTYTPLLVM